MIFVSSLFFPTSTSIAFENSKEFLPEFILNYFNNISLTNEDILSIFIFLSILHIFSLFLLLLSSRTINYNKETHALFSFFLTINTYFVLLISILYRLDVITLNLCSVIFNMNAGYFINFFSASSYILIWVYVIIVLIGFVKK